MKLLKILGKSFQILLTTILALAVLANLYMAGSRVITKNPTPTVFGYQWSVVLSGSMEPTVHVDALLVTKAQESYQTGDIITFRSGASQTTHRIIAITKDGYTTKGDANNTQDQDPVKPEMVVGKVVLNIPGVGRFVHFFRSPLGLIVLFAAAIAVIEIPYLIKKKKMEG